MTRKEGPSRYFSLLADDTFILAVDDALLDVVSEWMPLHRRELSTPGPPDGACIRVERRVATSDNTPPDAVLMRLGAVTAHALDAHCVALHGSHVHGLVSLPERSADIAIAVTEGHSEARTDVGYMLTLASALLLGRMGAALVHAGAVCDPAGRAWLLVGDTHAGKTTTCVSLADAGWTFMADDHVVLRAAATGGIVAEGWPRRAHLDAGYGEQVVSGKRLSVDVRERWSAASGGTAPVHAIVLPVVNAASPTAARRIAAADAFTALVRQSPWLLADAVAAPAVAELLRAVSLRPAFALDLGRDGYANGVLLARVLEAIDAAG